MFYPTADIARSIRPNSTHNTHLAHAADYIHLHPSPPVMGTSRAMKSVGAWVLWQFAATSQQEVVMQTCQGFHTLNQENRMLAVHAGNYTGVLIEDSFAMGDSPPMTSVRLRGGIAVSVVAIDRSFREVQPGVFEHSARLPANGQFEDVSKQVFILRSKPQSAKRDE